MTALPEARAARPDDAEAVLNTLCAAFDLNADAARPIFYADPFYDLSHKRVLAVPEVGVVSCLTVVPMTLRVGGIPVPAAGVAGVATRPEFQRRGYAAALLEATVPVLWNELCYPISLLQPLSAPFYRRFGWETASSTVCWAASPSSLLPSAGAKLVRRATAADWPGIIALHAEMTHGETGACVRDPRRWALIQMPVPGREVYVCEEADGVMGYAIWGRGDALQVLEMHGRTPQARRALAGFLARQPEPLAEWPASTALLAAFGFSETGTTVRPDMMLRVTDLEAALSAVHAALYRPVLADVRTSLTLHLTDPLCPVNTRPLRLTPRGVTVGIGEDRHWLRADIGALGPLYLGYSLPSDAHRAGLLMTGSAETLALADRLFPRRAPYLAPLDQS